MDQLHDKGSSPRVRGTHQLDQGARHRAGIIPACAGNTRHAAIAVAKNGDHPRVCGEHSDANAARSFSSGSSPRVRGTPPLAAGKYHRPGIIPACAGNTAELLEELLNDGDHPRVCGEHPPQCRKPDDRPGSSPRVRGTLPVVAEHLLRHGIIPACAGNTDFAALLVLPSRDHPRVCGEHLIPHLATSFGVGSSPRVRGTPEAFDAFMPYGGIIPACAGNTVCGEFSSAAWGDHPRVCGEHWASA